MFVPFTQMELPLNIADCRSPFRVTGGRCHLCVGTGFPWGVPGGGGYGVAHRPVCETVPNSTDTEGLPTPLLTLSQPQPSTGDDQRDLLSASPQQAWQG